MTIPRIDLLVCERREPDPRRTAAEVEIPRIGPLGDETMSFADAYGGGGSSAAADTGGGSGASGMNEVARESKKVAGLIFQMTTNVSSFKRLVDTLGTSKDTRELRGKLNKQRENIGAMAKDASLAVKRLAQTVTRGGDGDDDARAQHVARHQKLVKSFHAVLKAKDASFSVRRARARTRAQSTFLPQASPRTASYGANESSDEREGAHGASEQQALLMDSRRQELMHNEGEMEFNNALIEEREQGILEIQQQIGEVNEIFQDLAVLVNEQGQMIDDIEANIVSTAWCARRMPRGSSPRRTRARRRRETR